MDEDVIHHADQPAQDLGHSPLEMLGSGGDPEREMVECVATEWGDEGCQQGRYSRKGNLPKH